MRSPVLFLVFNRPDPTRRVFEAIRAARPAKLYVAADGPRAGRERETALCNQVRDIASGVDWPCEVKTLFRDHNLGCKHGVSSGIEWFFNHESEGIILEDDVLPIPTFFAYCDEMLERYRNDERVGMIAGCNLGSNYFRADASYLFSYYCNIWGWASWRRVWQHYDVAMTKWPAWREGNGLAKVSGGKTFFQSHWRRVLDGVHQGNINTWDYQWLFTCWRLGALTVLPAYSQISNLGFGTADATHTTADAPSHVTELIVRPLEWPLIHPETVAPELKSDALIGSKIYGINAMTRLKQQLKSLFR
jgi:hypothetical protein